MPGEIVMMAEKTFPNNRPLNLIHLELTRELSQPCQDVIQVLAKCKCLLQVQADASSDHLTTHCHTISVSIKFWHGVA